MTRYTRRPTSAIAWQFDRQHQSEWPAWVTSYIVAGGPLGQERVGLSGTGTLLVPVRGGNTLQGLRGDYLVLENFSDESGVIKGGTITLVRGQDFDQLFQAVGAPETEPAPAE